MRGPKICPECWRHLGDKGYMNDLPTPYPPSYTPPPSKGLEPGVPVSLEGISGTDSSSDSLADAERSKDLKEREATAK